MPLFVRARTLEHTRTVYTPHSAPSIRNGGMTISIPFDPDNLECVIYIKLRQSVFARLEFNYLRREEYRFDSVRCSFVNKMSDLNDVSRLGDTLITD